MLLLQSVKSFFKENKVLSCLFVILLTVCLVGSYFGVNYVLCQAYEYNLYQLEQRTFTLAVRGNGIPDISRIIEAYPNEIGAIYGETLLTTAEGNELTVMAYGYITELMGYEGTIPASFGRNMTAEELASGERVAFLEMKMADKDRIGDTVILNGEAYTVIGIANQTILPLASLTSIETVSIILMDIPTKDFTEEFSDFLREIHPASRVTASETADRKSFADFSPSLFPTAVLLLFGFLNLSYIYTYFLKMRKKQYTVYHICGASPMRIAGLCLGEIWLLVTGCMAVATAVYKIIGPWIYSAASMFFADRMGLLPCFALYGGVFALFAVVFLPTLLSSTLSITKKNTCAEV